MLKNKKYKKSINNQQCLGPCYQPNTNVIHPIFLTKIDRRYPDNDKPFCPTNFFKKKNEMTGVYEQKNFDICENPTHDKDIITAESFVIINSNFSKETFLSYYYDINSYEDSLIWIENNNFVHIETKIRIMNASLNLYGDKLDYFDEKFINFYISCIKELYIYLIYSRICNFIGIHNNNILIIDDKKNTLNKKDFETERINYIIEKFISFDNTKKFLFKFLSSKPFLFENIDDIILELCFENINFILSSIDSILKNEKTK